MMEETGMLDVEKLIELVRKRPLLWDRKNPHHQNKIATRKCWREISNEMDEDELKLRKKWKYLRDQFPVELGKASVSQVADADGNYSSKWPFFKSMLFMKGHVKARQFTYRPVKNTEREFSAQSVTEDDPLLFESSTYTGPSGVKRKREDEDDEHLYFFKSLLPHIRRIPPHRLLSFRSSVQESVEQYAYGSSLAASVPSEDAFDFYSITSTAKREKD